jgi:competence ComEA-like helix-hairpin-helix protein
VSRRSGGCLIFLGCRISRQRRQGKQTSGFYLKPSEKKRVLVTTLTKRLAEDLSGYFRDAGLKCKWLHSELELQKLPGIGPAKAQRIMEERERQPFVSIEDLRRVNGIGPKTLDRLRPYITVEKSAVDTVTFPDANP